MSEAFDIAKGDAADNPRCVTMDDAFRAGWNAGIEACLRILGEDWHKLATLDRIEQLKQED
jgi:hypothetical protein